MEILKKLLEFVMEILETVTFVGSLFIVIYLFFMQPHQVRGSSMDTTFRNNEYILTNKLSYRFGAPQRGDVVVFKSPENKDIDFIKRIIGLPGDKIMVEEGQVYLNGSPLTEKYILGNTQVHEGGFLRSGQAVTVPTGHLFVMGDNRARSSDSRTFGPIPQQDIIGKVFFRYFPSNRVGTIKTPNYSSESLRKNSFVFRRLPLTSITTFDLTRV
ncbi:signal peptidase I [Candidatus Woesebacteria bacterium]|nr:signal peptidase I [Candidatus Woesebacteria bacterium]